MNNNKKTYYLDFGTEHFLACKEMLKTMPLFYNSIYFCRSHANALWNGEGSEHYSCISMICKSSDIERLRQILKNNSLYMGGWDSKRFTNEDYGLSFIGGNIKFILMPFYEIEDGFVVKSYDCENGNCYETKVPTLYKDTFVSSNISEQGEIVRTCDFDISDINQSNTKVSVAERKNNSNVAVYESNKGFTLARTEMVLLVLIISTIIVWTSYMFLNFYLHIRS